MRSPLVSVIVPVYNVEHYLRRCLDSILNQTYSNIELIVVDDGSTDTSGKICDEYAKKDNRVFAVHKKNGGPSSARNVGLNVCKGFYISFVDGDDWIEPDFIKTLYSNLLYYKTKIAICAWRKQNDLIDFNIPPTGKYHWLDCFNKMPWGVNNKMYDSSLFSNLRFDETLLYAEDQDIFSKLMIKSIYISCIDIPLYNYYNRKDSLMHSNTYNPYYGIIARFGALLLFFKNGLRGKLLNKVFRKYYMGFVKNQYSTKFPTDELKLRAINIIKYTYNTISKKLTIKSKLFYRHPRTFLFIYKRYKKIKNFFRLH